MPPGVLHLSDGSHHRSAMGMHKHSTPSSNLIRRSQPKVQPVLHPAVTHREIPKYAIEYTVAILFCSATCGRRDGFLAVSHSSKALIWNERSLNFHSGTFLNGLFCTARINVELEDAVTKFPGAPRGGRGRGLWIRLTRASGRLPRRIPGFVGQRQVVI